MIYTYRYLNHSINQFHDNIAYFFEQLFALNLLAFDATVLFRDDFLLLIQSSKVLLRRFETIVPTYHQLTNAEQALVQEAFRNNNDIETICQCGCHPYKYNDLPSGIREPLKDLFMSLWEDYSQFKKVNSAYGTVKNHFDMFVSHNHQDALLCPFCGINILQPSEGLYRDAYDHFIPKAVYPFNSVNFKNLLPICYVCNSNAKRAKDVPFDDTGAQRAITYPYKNQPDRYVEAHIQYESAYDQSDQTLLSDTKTLWHVTLTESGSYTPEMDSWNAIYCIRKRYQDHIGQFERQWWKEMTKRYKRRRHTTFDDFKADILDDYNELSAIPMAILRKAYYSHLFQTPDIDKLIEATVA
ncbi:hypothetical protein [Spirosoma montaniterrae]|uniref:HNH nuclease domain-containing protein n=1 Tax=Spirosoma montaniterrae TaxID=1178516 RepID=A0A1P9WYY2_9BACT|nr:hypothetical protein [Spirosoma montaniterrae]AQG80596.1 hypothetical protein AWR27_15465 [Spirosoma montaniterrae]